MTREELDSLTVQLRREADVVEAMASEESASLAGLRASFVQTEFLSFLASKKMRMETLSQLRMAMRPLSERWMTERRDLALSDPGVELELSRIRNAFERLKPVEAELESLAAQYLKSLTASSGESKVQDRIALYRSWGN